MSMKRLINRMSLSSSQLLFFFGLCLIPCVFYNGYKIFIVTTMNMPPIHLKFKDLIDSSGETIIKHDKTTSIQKYKIFYPKINVSDIRNLKNNEVNPLQINDSLNGNNNTGNKQNNNTGNKQNIEINLNALHDKGENGTIDEVILNKIDQQENPYFIPEKKDDLSDFQLHGNVQINQNVSNFNVLLISSMGRSGSSFIGALLNSWTDVFYIYEPLHAMEKWNILNENSAVAFLRNVFLCTMEKIDLSYMRGRGKVILQNGLFVKCGSKAHCFTPGVLNTHCLENMHHLTKTIRLRVSWIKSFLEDTTLNTKVIHLVRDPRGSFLSGWAEGWSVGQRNCDNMLQDITAGKLLLKQYPDRFIVLKYETFCKSPWEQTQRLFSFIGIPKVPDSTLKYLSYHTSGRTRGKSHSKKRNTVKMSEKWRHEITSVQLELIQSLCKPTIEALGHYIFDNITQVRNMNVPLY